MGARCACRAQKGGEGMGTDCQECGEELLEEGVLYWDGQEIICPGCGTVHQVCCDSETAPHLHRSADGE